MKVKHQKEGGKKGSRAFVTPWGGNVDDLAVGRGRPGAILRRVNGVQIHKYILMKVLRSQHPWLRDQVAYRREKKLAKFSKASKVRGPLLARDDRGLAGEDPDEL